MIAEVRLFDDLFVADGSSRTSHSAISRSKLGE